MTLPWRSSGRLRDAPCRPSPGRPSGGEAERRVGQILIRALLRGEEKGGGGGGVREGFEFKHGVIRKGGGRGERIRIRGFSV